MSPLASLHVLKVLCSSPPPPPVKTITGRCVKEVIIDRANTLFYFLPQAIISSLRCGSGDVLLTLYHTDKAQGDSWMMTEVLEKVVRLNMGEKAGKTFA